MKVLQREPNLKYPKHLLRRGYCNLKNEKPNQTSLRVIFIQKQRVKKVLFYIFQLTCVSCTGLNKNINQICRIARGYCKKFGMHFQSREKNSTFQVPLTKNRKLYGKLLCREIPYRKMFSQIGNSHKVEALINLCISLWKDIENLLNSNCYSCY